MISGFHKVVLLGCFLLGSRILLHAQEVTPVPADTTATEPEKVKKIPRHNTGIFISVSLENGNQYNSRGNLVFFGAGIEYEGFLAGAYTAVFDGNVKELLIFPNEFKLIYAHGGAYLGRRLWKSRFFQTDAVLNWGKGNMLWERTDNFADFQEDRFTTLEAELIFSYKPIMPVQFYASVGYRSFQGLKLTQVEQSDFEGVTINMGFRLGLFRSKEQ